MSVSALTRLCGVILLAAFVVGARAAGDGEKPLIQDLAIADVAVSIDESALIDWQTPGTPIYDAQNTLIADIFRTAALDGASTTLVGQRPAILAIRITHFDILSNLEKFFCCAKNEVSANYQILDAATGDVIVDEALLNFDHIGRGGFLALIDRSQGKDQLGRLFDLISERTSDWLKGG